MDKKIFHYSVIRYVPCNIRGEFINIAIVLTDRNRSFYRLRVIEDLTRASYFAPSSDVKEVISALYEYDLADLVETPPSVRSCLRCERPVPMMAKDANDAMNELWDDFIKENV